MLKLSFLALCASEAAGAANIGLIFGTRKGSTAHAARIIGAYTGLDPIPIQNVDPEQFKEFDHYIVGLPTYVGSPAAQQGRSGTDWDVFMAFMMKRMGSFEGKKVAVFGTGDQRSYPFQFCDAMDDLAGKFKELGATLIGHVDTESYDQGFQMSDSVWDDLDGKFVGLPLDLHSQEELTGPRIEAWVQQLKDEGMPIENEGAGECRRRRSLQAVAMEEAPAAVTTKEAWYSEWGKRMNCWLSEGGASVAVALQDCTVAFGAFLAARAGEQKGSHSMQGVYTEPGCEWVHSLQRLPSFPNLDVFSSVEIPSLPRLVPWSIQKWDELGDQSSVQNRQVQASVQNHQQAALGEALSRVTATTPSEDESFTTAAVGAGIAFGASFAAGAMLVLGIRRFQGHSTSSTRSTSSTPASARATASSTLEMSA